MDSKPLLQDVPPAYNSVPAAYNYQQPQPGYGAIPQQAPAPGPAAAAAPAAFPPAPPPYQFPATQGYPAAAGQASATGTPANYSSTYTIIQPSVVVVGGCPACRVGVLEEDFTCLGIMCAIFFFPLGILFCLALRQRRCPNCGATFG